MSEYHTLKVDEVLAELQTKREGLSATDAATRLSQNGENKLQEPKKSNWFIKFLLQFKDVMVIVLLAAAAITAVVAIVEHKNQEFIDVGIILAIVIINAIIGVVQESKAEQALDALKKMSQPFAKVRRNGEITRVESSKLVVGDIVILEAGDVVPADVRIIDDASLKIEESSLTGESLPVLKSADAVCETKAGIGDRINMAFSTSVVTYGRGEGVVTATGMAAEMGKIANMLNETENVETPIQRKLNKTGKIISIVVLGIAGLIFLIGILSSIHIEITADKIINSFMTAVAIAVAAIPEGLTAVITITMALGVQKMSARNAIIRKLPAVETLGSTEIICSDKTGTLTLNKMTVQKTYILAETENDTLLKCMVLCNDSLTKNEDGKYITMGDPTETALVQYGHKISEKYDKIALETNFPRVDEVPFDSDRKLMTTINVVNGVKTVFTKGAPDCLLVKCTNILENGKIRKLTDDDRDAILAKNHEFAQDALRVLAYATRDAQDKEDYETNLTFIGLTGMIDPPRDEVKAAVEVCRKAGITPVMITGDHPDTAFAIAKQLGIATDESQKITGAELGDMTDEQLRANVEKYRVYARVSPEHKVRIVNAWQSKGKIVAMTGDGVNDAPSIKAADIGIGMGITGTDVTKGAADMVLADDNFATIVTAVGEGRKIYNNMQKTIQFLLAANMAEVIALLVATIIFSFSNVEVIFLLPIQILWINLVTDSLPALALGMEPSTSDLMSMPPHKSSDNLFAGRVGLNIIYQGILQSIIVLTVFLCAHYCGWEDAATTMAFIVLSLVQLFHCFNVKSLNGTIFHKDFFKNRFMLLSFAIGAVLTIGVALIPFTHSIFKLTYLSPSQWAVSLCAALSIIPLVELGKFITNLIIKHKEHKKTV